MCVCVYTYIQAHTDVHTRYTYRVVMDGPLPRMHSIYFNFKKLIIISFHVPTTSVWKKYNAVNFQLLT